MIARRVTIDRISRSTIVLTVVLAALCVLSGTGSAPSVLFGGAVSLMNLRLIRMLVSRLMTPDAAGPRLSSVVATKFLLLLALVAVSLKRLPVDGPSFLLGASTLFLAIVLEGLVLGEPVGNSGDEGAEQ